MKCICLILVSMLAGLSTVQASAAAPDRLAVQRRQMNRCMTHRMLGDRSLTYLDARKFCQPPPVGSPADKLAANVTATAAVRAGP